MSKFNTPEHDVRISQLGIPLGPLRQALPQAGVLVGEVPPWEELPLAVLGDPQVVLQEPGPPQELGIGVAEREAVAPRRDLVAGGVARAVHRARVADLWNREDVGFLKQSEGQDMMTTGRGLRYPLVSIEPAEHQ